MSIVRRIAIVGVTCTMNRNTFQRSFLFLSALLLTLTTACGYRLYHTSSLPFTSVSIGPIENKTYEPKVQDMLHDALTKEFLKQGVQVVSASELRLSGVIKSFDLRILSEKSDVAVQYEVVMKGDFRLTEASGTEREFKDVGSPFIVSFAGSGDLNELLAFKEGAEERAVRDMASEIVSVLIYRFESE